MRPSEPTMPGKGQRFAPLTPTPTFSGAARGSAPRRERAIGFSTAQPMPSMHDLAGIVRDLSRESDLMAGVVRLQRSALRLLRVSDALCAWIDWPRRIAWSVTGRLSEQLEELVLEVAGRGRRELVGNALLEPVGPAPARAVLALRRPGSTGFGNDELAMIGALAIGIAPSIDRLIGRPARRPLPVAP